jgi:hypothetical protein
LIQIRREQKMPGPLLLVYFMGLGLNKRRRWFGIFVMAPDVFY